MKEFTSLYILVANFSNQRAHFPEHMGIEIAFPDPDAIQEQNLLKFDDEAIDGPTQIRLSPEETTTHTDDTIKIEPINGTNSDSNFTAEPFPDSDIQPEPDIETIEALSFNSRR